MLVQCQFGKEVLDGWQEQFMGIRSRLEDAHHLWIVGRKEGAVVNILIAASATARLRYPKSIEKSDAACFKRFIRDEMGTITGGPKYNVAFPFGGVRTSLEDILYTHLRCNLVHEATVPSSISFTDPLIENGRVYAVLKLDNPLGFPLGWVLNLHKAVLEAKENDAEFGRGC